MRVALVHYWLVGMRGGERVLEQICELFPQADIFTHVINREKISERLLAHRIETTSISRLPFSQRYYRHYLPFMPRALEELDLSQYDLVISSESGPAKGVIVAPHAKHICYCHSPMRYLWDHYHTYRASLPALARPVFSRVAHRLRLWDAASATRVDKFVANSQFVAQRIERYYGRSADVINPPVAVDRLVPIAAPSRDYYLLVSELVGYKRADIAVDAFQNLDRRLLIAGDGPDAAKLRAKAPRNVIFLGRVSDGRLQELYSNCRALVFPGEEDFGIVPVEAMACGRPVIAYGRGGIKDSVLPGRTGIFFFKQSAEALRSAIAEFESKESEFDALVIREHAQKFSDVRFRDEFRTIVEETMSCGLRPELKARPHAKSSP